MSWRVPSGTGKRNKSPGQDGIRHEFFVKVWDFAKQDLLDVVNDMYFHRLTDAQKSGKIVCLPKKTDPMGPAEYGPLTLLNIDYKLLTRITSNRIRPWLYDILHNQQYSGRHGAPILQAVASLRDIIAYAEISNTPVCVLTLDFQEAFNMVSHSCIYMHYLNNIILVRVLYGGFNVSITMLRPQSK
jgi:hypothetical protein